MVTIRELLYETLATWGRGWSFESVAQAGETLGALLWHGLPRRARLATDSVARHLDVSPPEAQRIARASFGHAGRAFLEVFLTQRIDWRFIHERLVVPEAEQMAQLVALDRPLVCTTGHLGAWELQAGLMGLTFPRRGCLVIVRRPKDLALHHVVTRLRRRPNADFVDHRRAVFAIQRVLRRKGLAAFLADHNCSRDEAIFLPFLGEVAAVNAGPALMAVRAEAVIATPVMVRLPDGRYCQHLGPCLDTRQLTGSRDEKVRAATMFIADTMADFVRRYPEQWFWMHRRWKTRPEGEGKAGER